MDIYPNMHIYIWSDYQKHSESASMPHALGICRLISVADGDTQMQFLNHSEVNFVCVRLPRFRTWVRHWSLRKKNKDVWLAHTQQSIHWAIYYAVEISMVQMQSLRHSLCGRLGEHQIVCGDWLVCQTTSPSNKPITCMARILACAFCAYVCSDITRTAISKWGPFGRWTPRCSLAHWTSILLIRQHILWESPWGST